VSTVDRRRMAWFTAAWLGVVAVLGVIRGTMPGLIFALVMIGLALFCAVIASATTGADIPPSPSRERDRRIGPIVGHRRPRKH
jgi:uncharacterized protein (DUF58 family)